MPVIRMSSCNFKVPNAYLCKIAINCVLFTALFLTLVGAILQTTENARPVLFTRSTNITDTSCYYLDRRDHLPLLNSAQFSPPAKSIFFHEVSCKGGLDSRQACTVESAARNNPSWQIYVLFTGPVNKKMLNRGSMAVLRQFKNIKFLRIQANEYSAGTNFEHSLKGEKLQLFNIYQIGDVLKYITLGKWGGIAMDMDMMTLKPFDDNLPHNFAAKVSEAVVGDAIIALAKDEVGRNISMEAISMLQTIKRENYHKVITRVLKKTCFSDEVYYMHSGTCNGFEVYPAMNFYPISFDGWQKYYQPRDVLVTGYPDDVFTHYLWNSLSGRLRVPNNALYADLAKMCCPAIYNLYADNFGN